MVTFSQGNFCPHCIAAFESQFGPMISCLFISANGLFFVVLAIIGKCLINMKNGILNMEKEGEGASPYMRLSLAKKKVCSMGSLYAAKESLKRAWACARKINWSWGFVIAV